MDDLEFLSRLAEGICAEFGPACEVVVHDLSDLEHSVAHICNGHVTGREAGDAASDVVREAAADPCGERPDRLAYRTTTSDGRVLKSTTIYQYGEDGRVRRIFSINLDISQMLGMRAAIDSLVGPDDQARSGEATAIPAHVEDVLDELIAQSIRLAGCKAPATMTRDEKKAAIQFLWDSGAFLITKAGERIARQFGISKYTMYSYIGASRAEADGKHGA